MIGKGKEKDRKRRGKGYEKDKKRIGKGYLPQPTTYFCSWQRDLPRQVTLLHICMRKAATSDEQVSKRIRKLLQKSFPPHMNTQGRIVEYRTQPLVEGERLRERDRGGERDKERERD